MSKLSKALTITMMLLGAALLPASAASPATTVKVLTLAKGGATDYVIVRPANPIPAEQTAVADLAAYLKRVTGAEFKIVPEAPAAKPAKAIYVGATTFAASQGIDPAACDPEEWVVKTFGDDVVISGGKPWGARWGVYDFLESAAGVHMFDTFSEDVPSRPTLEVAAPDIRVRPAFRWQVLHSGNLRDSGPLTKKYEDFNRQTRYQSQRSWVVGSPGLCHTFGFYIDPDEYGKDHPEYFAVHKKMDGTRHRNTDAKGGKNYGFDLCLSNPDVRKIVIGKLRGFIKADREKAAKEGNAPPLIYEIQQNDGLPGHGPNGNGCLCPECRKIVERESAESGLYIDFINAVADAVKDEYPDILIQTFAYNHTVNAPKHIHPHDNVMIMWCDYIPSDWFRPLTHEVNKPQRELLESWARISKNMAVYDYWSVLQEHTPGFYIPSSSISCVKSDLEYFQKNNVKRIWIGSFPDFRPNDYFTDDEVHNFYALKVWLGCKLLLDPAADEKKLLDTFFTGYYGPAAGKMREFMDYVERRQNAYPGKLLYTVKREDFYKTHLDLEFFRTVEGILDAAEAAVVKDPLRLARVKRERIPVDSALLHLEPSLRKAYSAQGEAYPFDRERVLARYAANWAVFLENFVPAANRENARAFVEKRLSYLRSMPMITAESIRHRATPVVDSAIKIDGVLNESAWKNATPFYLTPLNKLEPLKTKTAVRTLWSREMLYIAFECFDDRMSDIKFEPRPKDHPDTWRDSAVEVFLNPSGDRRTYYQIIVNPAGSQVDTGYETRENKLNPDGSWDCKATVAVKVNPNSWVVEMAVPFKAIGFEAKPGAAIVANFCRSRHLKSDAAASQLTAWSPLLIRGFHDLERFGTLVLAGGNDEQFASFEGQQDMPVLSLRSGCLVKVSQEKERASDGQSSLRVEFPPTKGKVDVGVSIGRSDLTDWSGFKSLVADIFYEGEWDYWQWSFNARLDGDNKQLYYQGVLGSPRLKSACWNKNVVICDLAKAAEKVDLKHVKKFYLYIHSSPERAEPIVLFLDNIRLVRKTGGDK